MPTVTDDQRAAWREIALKYAGGDQRGLIWFEDDVLNAIAEAVALERERICKMAERAATEYAKGFSSLDHRVTALNGFAAAIRALGDRK